ncbi:MAG: hypothetical protein CO030_00005 [Candidatus Magasanikbacteria bacterium CG_4_9_14_0_2_um_filter_42_11]|uniref:Uncharacterized protein n=1 Tax=Candidatus Magasanikbacteria bacterium CG_4_9_14_0_2_um_filter_42_11 TaxID=1974643 RepID=A0A2M8FB93_9BACT|nr:MAG: hypothetical protein COU34_03270 [Candidatus Magasanikbacteria bacterium CG10_big_fil_rev_8_21_14_0_10_43_9]PIY92165.1 MAG: hypothetical protein COY70_04675 [Candidatus Magasanikbacteria bacterium CG_4_10_14_0_8_um_filter_42_12]PJC52982.1 MAG: hypothetical protein CO030_00005 [Candidatus Magasanikbacteria bacterium CG_4_9_14_0_2_um_filter_42_11]
MSKKEFRILFSDKEWFPDHPAQNACGFKDLVDHKNVSIVAYFVIDGYADGLARICVSFDDIETDNQRKFIFENQLSELKKKYGQPLYTKLLDKNGLPEHQMSELDVWINENSVISAVLTLSEDGSLQPNINISFGDKINDPISKEWLWIENKVTGRNLHIEKTLDIVFSSTRTMPARFSTSGDRRQSFCVSFSPLKHDADEEMAAQAYGAINFYLSNEKRGYELDQKTFHSVLMIGEDLMLGSFILTKFKEENSFGNIKQAIINHRLDNLEKTVPNLKAVLIEKEVENYFQHCVDFGRDTAQK